MKAAMNVLRDQVWQFIGAFLGLITLGATIYLFLFGQQTKILQVVVLANTSLVEVEQTVAQNIRISYKGEDISNLSLVQIKLENIGNKPINEADYVRPIKLLFPPQARIIEASIAESNPTNIGMSIENDQNTATLSKVLLNPKDRVIVRFLIADIPPQVGNTPFQLDARIVEIQNVSVITAIAEPAQNINRNDILNVVVITCGILALIVMAFGGLSFIILRGSRTSVDRVRILTIFGVVVVILLAIAEAIVNIFRS